METLANMYEESPVMNKIHLIHRLFNLRMAEGAFVVEQLNEFNTVTTYLISISINFNEVRVLILLSSLYKSCNGTVTVVSGSVGKKTLEFNDLEV